MPAADIPVPSSPAASLALVVYDDGLEELALWTDPPPDAGPATATIVSVAPPGRDQRCGDVVSVEPIGWCDLPAGEPGGLPRLAHRSTLRRGNFRCTVVEGPHPGLAAWLRLDRQITARGWVLWVVERTGGRGGRFGGAGRVLAHVAVPAEVDPVEVDAVLAALTEDWARPPRWTMAHAG